MRTELQREASRLNGAKSRGPKSPEGKAVTKFNGLVHGLRAEELVLPGEDPAAFEAERRAWIDDWRPRSHTRAVLVERAAVASWRLRRATRSEAACRRQRGEEAERNYEIDRRAKVERAIDRFEDDPGAAVVLLRTHAAGIDRLLASWGGLAEALDAGHGAWTRPLHHARLMLLLGLPLGVCAAISGDAAQASNRLSGVNDTSRVVTPLAPGEAEELTGTLRRAVSEAIAGLREHRAEVADPDRERAEAVAAACADDSRGAQLQH